MQQKYIFGQKYPFILNPLYTISDHFIFYCTAASNQQHSMLPAARSQPILYNLFNYNPKPMQLFLACLALVLWSCRPQLFQITSTGASVSNNNTLVPLVSYDLNFSIPSDTINSASTLGIKFSDRYKIPEGPLSNCRASTSAAVAPTAVSTCTVTYYPGSQIYEIVMGSVFPTTTTYNFLRVSFVIDNPYAARDEPLNATIYYPANNITGYGIAFINYAASALTGCAISSSSTLTGANSTHTFAFTPSQRMITNSQVNIVYPVWDPSTTTGVNSSSPLICTGVQGTDNTGLTCTTDLPITSQTITISDGLVSGNKSATTVRFSISSLRNAWSLLPFGPISIQLMYNTYLSQTCTNVYQSVTDPNTLSIFNFTISNFAISATNTGVRIVFGAVNPFPRPANRVQLTFPAEMTVTYSGSLTVFSQSSTQITLAGVTTASTITGFTVVTPPSSRPFTLSFTTFRLDSGTAYAIETRSMTNLACTVGSITNASASALVRQVNAITTYTLSFTIANRLIANSFISIVFPTQLSIQTGTASCSMAGHSCSISSASNVTVTILSTVNPSSSLAVTVTSVRNSNEALTTDSFAIYTYYDAGFDSLVNRVLAGITIALQPKTISGGLVTPSSLVTYALAQYRIDLTLVDPIPAGGYIVVVFPSATVPQANLTIVAASFVFASCSVSQPVANTVNITNCFTATMSNLSFSITMSNVLNPISFRPTASLSLQTRGPSGSPINSISTGLSVTMSTSATALAFSVTPSSAIVGAVATYVFQLTHTIPTHSLNDYVIVSFPALMTIPLTPTCIPISGIASISCLYVSATQLKVVYLSAPGATVKFSLANVVNYLIGDQAVNYGMVVYDGSDYEMEKFSAFAVTYTENSLTSVIVNNDNNIALGELSNITLTITNSINLYASLNVSLTQLRVIIPAEFVIGSSCTATSGTCARTSSTTYTITGVGLSLSALNITMTNITLNYFAPSSSSFSLAYTYNNNNISVLDSGAVVLPYCTSPCRRCSTSRTACRSCLPAPNTLIYLDATTSSCALACVPGKYPDANNECQSCTSPCLECTGINTCTSCVNGTWLYNSTCVPLCPARLYNSSNGKCQACVLPCDECRSLTSCISCAVDFLSNNWCVSASSCPAATYANTTTKKCQPCVAPCSNCSIQPDNCTSCQSGLFYYSNLCVVSCPPGMYSSGLLCLSCSLPCSACVTTATNCTACATDFLSNSSCVSASSCPNTTYANATTRKCQPCSSPCLSCSLAATNCTTCQNGFLFYDNICSSTCPVGMYASGLFCFNCSLPCSACVTTATNCTACATNFLSNGSCVSASSCPNTTYANVTTRKCQQCVSPCSSCLLAATNCTSCQNGFLYYDNICAPTCPIGMYASGLFCFNCTLPCSACSGTATNCTSCATNFLSNGSCVDSTSCPAGTYPNSTSRLCKTCPNSCTQCTNQTNCSACQSPVYLFYNFWCYLTCPAGTYQSGALCLNCSASCASCRGLDTNCTSCNAPLVFSNNQCLGSCPVGTYNNTGTCSNCMPICAACTSASTCSSCNGSRYFQGSTCVTDCASGWYQNTVNNTCTLCSAPCSQCQNSGTNCTRCISPQVQFENSCRSSCPLTYFAVNGSCRTCPNCINCLDSSTCLSCKPGFYQYNGVCYTSCPAAAPIADDTTNTCGKCDATCLTCVNTAKNCSSCYSQTYLYKGTCLIDCPLSFIQDPISGTCKEPLIGNVVYFPFSFLFLFFLIIGAASKCMFPQAESVTTLGALISECEFGSWCLLAYIASVDYNLEANLISLLMYVSLAAIVLSVGVGATYAIAIYKQYQSDKGLQAWKQFDQSCVLSYRVVNLLSCFSFRFFRILYSKMFNRVFLSMYIADGARFLTATSRLTIMSLLFNTVPMVGISCYVVYRKQIYDQTFFCLIDTVILGFVSAVLLTVDSCKDKDQLFEVVKQGLPFLKYRNMKNDESMTSQSLLSKAEQDPKHRKSKSSIDPKQQEELFRRITWLPNLNKFGHLNTIEINPDDQETKSLPEFDKLQNHPQFHFETPQHKESEDILEGDSRVVDEELFFMEEEQAKIRQAEEEQLRQEEQKAMEEEERRREEELHRYQEEEKKRIELEARRRQLMEEDEDERVNLEFPDLAAIEKIEGKQSPGRKSALDILKNTKKMNERPIDEKSMKKLEELGKKNGIDPNFMKETFGIDKNHNAELLNQIIDKHNHVKRQSVKQLFSEQNDPVVLQQLFGKNSTMDPKKLRDILNDPDSAAMIKKLADKDEGILSADVCKQLFEQNGKYTKEFTKNLLSDSNGMDQSKLKFLLKQSAGKSKDNPLKALKKIAGENLENTQILSNMLGQEAVLDPENFTKVANELSSKAIANIFANKGKNSNITTSKILNNKKINLKNLVPILQDEQLLHEMAEILGEGDPNIEQNLINLFKNADNIDPTKLKHLLTDPVIKQRLLTKPIDPSFLEAVLDKNSKSDLGLLSQTLKQMPEELIEQTFRFDPEKNTDFKNLAELFDANPKTDPALVSQMLKPDMVKKLYVKGNDTKMLNKLVEKGNEFDSEVIKNVYGDHRTNIFDSKTDANQGMHLDEDKHEQSFSHKQYSLGFKKNHHKSQTQVNMSRTAGGAISFLTPIVPVNNKNIKNGSKQFNTMNPDEWSSEESDEEEEDKTQFGQIKQQQSTEQILTNDGKKRKKPQAKKMKKKVSDVRHPAQQVYLQRIEAPHEYAMRKASIRKKKRKPLVPGVMDEDNDIFDMDF